MVNIVDILQKFDFESLVLFDELGAGTDPQEGAALAISILDEVHGRGARVMATTHYPELKAYGYNRPGVANASVEFDIETLSPTYRLLIGVPGRSNAFEISSRLGLPESIIDRAKSFTGTDRHEVESMIASLEETRRQSEDDAERSHELLMESEELRKELQGKLQAYEERKEALDKKRKKRLVKLLMKQKEKQNQLLLSFEKCAKMQTKLSRSMNLSKHVNDWKKLHRLKTIKC